MFNIFNSLLKLIKEKKSFNNFVGKESIEKKKCKNCLRLVDLERLKCSYCRGSEFYNLHN